MKRSNPFISPVQTHCRQASKPPRPPLSSLIPPSIRETRTSIRTATTGSPHCHAHNHRSSAPPSSLDIGTIRCLLRPREPLLWHLPLGLRPSTVEPLSSSSSSTSVSASTSFLFSRVPPPLLPLLSSRGQLPSIPTTSLPNLFPLPILSLRPSQLQSSPTSSHYTASALDSTPWPQSPHCPTSSNSSLIADAPLDSSTKHPCHLRSPPFSKTPSQSSLPMPFLKTPSPPSNPTSIITDHHSSLEPNP